MDRSKNVSSRCDAVSQVRHLVSEVSTPSKMSCTQPVPGARAPKLLFVFDSAVSVGWDESFLLLFSASSCIRLPLASTLAMTSLSTMP